MSDIIYKSISMQLLGKMTQLPDSQKIFGSLMYMCSELYSSEKVSELVASVKNSKFHFALSNMLPKGYLPIPKTYLLNSVDKDKDDSGKRRYNEIKKRGYIKEKDCIFLLNNPEESLDIYPFVNSKPSQQLRAFIESIFYDLPGLEPNLFSVPETVVVEISKREDLKQKEPEYNEKRLNEFNFFISFDDNKECKLIYDAIETAYKNKRTFILGPRASQGLNHYVISGISSVNFSDEDTCHYLNLGMLLPQAISYCDSYLEIFTSERRPYDMPNGWDKNKTGKFLSFVEEGSIISSSNGIKNIGESIQSPFKKDDIVFGNAFQYPIKMGGGCK